MSHNINWRVTFADETYAASQESSWSDFSDKVCIDGVWLYLSRSPISQITITDMLGLYSLIMEEPQKCFGFHRWGALLTSEQSDSQWLYGAFGYFTDDSRIILQATQTSGRMLIQKRSTPFVL